LSRILFLKSKFNSLLWYRSGEKFDLKFSALEGNPIKLGTIGRLQIQKTSYRHLHGWPSTRILINSI
jgi:hypothetical protein